MSAQAPLICDVGPRDGLQNESHTLTPAVRAEMCERLSSAGLPRVEAVSFVNPARVPQMAGAEEVLDAWQPSPGTVRAGLILNERGYDRALRTSVQELHYAFPVTDAFCERNQGCTVAESMSLAARLAERARADAMRFTVTLGASFGCPFEGAVEAARVLSIADEMAVAGAQEIIFADTIGVGVPTQVRELLRGAEGLGIPLGCHFHNTRNTGFANAVAAVETGAAVLDASLGGVGGCPFAPRATGNICTEDLVYLLHGMGLGTGIDLDALLVHASWLAEQLGKDLPGQLYKAGNFNLATR